jgi:carnitine-CoA ligase
MSEPQRLALAEIDRRYGALRLGAPQLLSMEGCISLYEPACVDVLTGRDGPSYCKQSVGWRRAAMADWQYAEQETIVESFWDAVDQAPDTRYLWFPGGQTYTYADTHREVARLAQGLLDLGVKPGDAVTTMLDNTPDAVFMWHAIVQIGAISVAINTALRGDFLRHVVTDAGSSVFVGEPDYVERLCRIADEVPNVKYVFQTGAQTIESSRFSIKSLNSMRLDPEGFVRRHADPEDVCCLVYSGGTTGPSKGCMMSQNYLMKNARQNNDLVWRKESETSFNPCPIYHANLIETGVIGPLVQKATSAIGPKFSVREFWPAIKASGAKVAFLTGSMPIMIAQMEDTPEMLECRGQLRALHAMPLAPSIEEIWIERFGCEIAGAKGYGLTECHLVVDFAGGTKAGAKPGSAGKRNHEFDCRIFDDSGHELGPNEVGEIVARPLRPNRMFSGYWKRPADTLRVSKDLWFHTGDLGMFDEDGFFFFKDRKKDYLRRRGENVSSLEVEGILIKHPDIIEVAVHAVASEFAEDDLKVTAVKRPGSKLAHRELFEWTVERLPYYALPRYIEFRDELPKGPVGRVQKFVLRDEGCTSATWDREKENVHFERR